MRKKGPSRLYMQTTLLRMSYDCGGISDLGIGLLGQQYLGCRREETRQTDQDRSVLQCPLDPVQVVGDGRMIAKQSSQMDNNSHPMHDITTALGISLSDKLKDHYCRSFLPAAVRLDNCSSTAHCNPPPATHTHT